MLKGIYNFFRKHYRTRYHGIYRNAKKLFVFDLALLALALTMFVSGAFFFFWKPTIADLIDLNFSYGSERILTGDEMKLTVEYHNRSKHRLTEAILAVRLPKGFVIDRNKTNEQILSAQSTANIGSIDPGATGKIEIYGSIFAVPNTDEKISAFLTYRPEDKSTNEQKIGAVIFHTAGATISAELVCPDTSFPGRDIPATLVLTNNGQTALSGLSVEDELAKPFAEANKLKNISIKPGETIKIEGSIHAPDSAGTSSQKMRLNITANGQTLTILTWEKKLAVFYPEIKSGLKSLFEGKYADGGDVLPIRVYWQNASAYTVKNSRLRFSFTPGTVDLRATARDNNLTIEGQDLIADNKTRTALASGAPGASDEFEIQVELLSFFRTDNQSQIEIKVRAEAELPDVGNQKFISEGSEAVRLPLATQLTWQVYPLYYTVDGDQLGRGPLPPTVGETTKYWIFVEIGNSVNPIAKNSFTATLADGVEFTGKQSVTIGPELSYNKGTNTLSWSYNLSPAFAKIGLYFEVAVTPISGQVGKKIVLMKNAGYSAVDDVTNKNLSLSHASVDNALSDNDQGSAAPPEVTN